MSVATETAGYQLITRQFSPKLINSGKAELVVQGWLLTTVCAVAMGALVMVVVELALTWQKRPSISLRQAA